MAWTKTGDAFSRPIPNDIRLPPNKFDFLGCTKVICDLRSPLYLALKAVRDGDDQIEDWEMLFLPMPNYDDFLTRFAFPFEFISKAEDPWIFRAFLTLLYGLLFLISFSRLTRGVITSRLFRSGIESIKLPVLILIIGSRESVV